MKNKLNLIISSMLMMVVISGIKSTTAQTWEPTNGPFGGGISCLAATESYLFAGTGGNGLYGNGVFRSSDNGLTWTGVNGLSTLHALVVSGSYLVASSGAGIYRSGNNGDSWTQCSYPGAYPPNAFATDGINLYAGGYAGFYSSADNGLTWISRNTNFPGVEPPNVPDIKSLAISGTYLYASTFQKGVFRSADNAASWTTVNTGLGTSGQVSSRTFNNLVVNGSDIYMGSGGQGVFRLLGNGTTWTNEITGLTNSAKNVRTLLVKDSQIYCGGNDGLWRSNSSGTMTWIRENGDLGIQQFGKLLANGSDVFAGIGAKGVYCTGDNFLTWTSVNQGIRGLSTRTITTGPGGAILAATYEGNIYSTSDEGATWIAGNLGAEAGPHLHGNTLFAGTGGNLFRSADNGATWLMLPQFYEFVSGPAYTFYSKGDTLFAGASGFFGIYYSTDNGETWNATSGIWNLNPNGGYPTVISITSIGKVMYAGTINGVFKSIDNGLSWNTCYPAMANIPIRSIVARDGFVFAGTSNFYDDPTLSAIGVYRSEDNGLSWIAVNSGLGNLDVGSMVFNGTDLYAGTKAGVYKSTNNGTGWTTFNEGFSTVPNATSLYIKDNYMYSGNWTITTPVHRRALSGSVPLQPVAISGSAAPCIGSTQTYSVPNIPGETYTWQVPSNWIIANGNGTSIITVTVGSFPGIILVIPSNGWGSGPAQYAIVSPNSNPPVQPGVIAGSTTPLEGTTQNYSVVNDPGVSYSWTFPSGWAQTAGGNTNSVSVLVGSAAGNIQVTPATNCGAGTPRTLAVTPVPSSFTISTVTIASGQTKCYNATGAIYVAGSGNTFIIENGGSATMIAGQNIIYSPETKVLEGGYMHGYISTEFCPNPSSPVASNPIQTDVVQSTPQMVVNSSIRIYPNPAANQFTLELLGAETAGLQKLEIYSLAGMKVVEHDCSGNHKQTVSVVDLVPGVYVVKVMAGGEMITLKLVKL